MEIFLAKLLTTTGPFLAKYWKVIAIVALLGTNVLTLHSCGEANKKLNAEKAAHKADNKAYHDAQAAAQKMADDMKARLEKENKEKAHAADANYSALYAKYRTSLVRYQAAQSAARKSGARQQDGTPASDNGPSRGPFLPEGSITITNEDANICAVNTARLQAIHEWADKLHVPEG